MPVYSRNSTTGNTIVKIRKPRLEIHGKPIRRMLILVRPSKLQAGSARRDGMSQAKPLPLQIVLMQRNALDGIKLPVPTELQRHQNVQDGTKHLH